MNAPSHFCVHLALMVMVAQLPAGEAPALEIMARHPLAIERPAVYGKGDAMRECFLLGDGSLGCSVSAPEGRVERIRFTFSHNDYWRSFLSKADGKNEPVRAQALKPHYVPSRSVNVNPGFLLIEAPALAGAHFRQELDHQRAELRTELRQGGVALTITSVLPKGGPGVLINRLANTGTEPLSLCLITGCEQVPTPLYRYDCMAGAEPGLSWVTRRTPLGDPISWFKDAGEDDRFRMWAALATRVLEGAVTGHDAGVADGPITGTCNLTLAPGATVTALTAVACTGLPLTREPADPLPAARAMLAADAHAVDTWITAHRTWWEGFWRRSWVDIASEPLMEAIYYGSLYIFGCANQPGRYPSGCNSWGWKDAPMWTGDYHWNYNIQAPYYQAFSSDRVELSEPYDRVVREHDELIGRRIATREKRPGTFFCIGTAPGGQVNENLSGYGHRTNALQAALVQCDHWRHTYDLDWLRSNFGFLRQIALYWDDDLLRHRQDLPDGSYRFQVANNAPLEGCGGSLNASPALGFLRYFYTTMLDMVPALVAAGHDTGFSATDQERWRDFLAHLADYPVGEALGRKVVMWSADDPDPFAVGKWHWNLLQVYPAHQVGLGSEPALRRMHLDALLLRPEILGGGGIYTEYWAIMARLGAYAPELFESFNRHVSERMGPGHYVVQGGNMECVAIVDEIHNCLMQSHEGFLRLFPAWHHDAARFGGMRAVGAFLVSATRAERVCRELAIVSEKGRECAVLNPWPGRSVEVIDSEDAPVATNVTEQHDGQVVRFPTRAGCRYILRPREGYPVATPFANAALHAAVTVSSTAAPRKGELLALNPDQSGGQCDPRTWRASNLTDGNRELGSVFCFNMGWASEPSPVAEKSEWVQLDLGREERIAAVHLWPMTRGDVKYESRYQKAWAKDDHAYDGFPLDFRIQVSRNGADWETVAERIGFLAMQPAETKPQEALGPQRFAFTECSARHVRLEATRLRKSRYFPGYVLRLAEIEVLRAGANVP